MKKINFSRIHVFPFSAHEKTPAYSMPNQISKQEKQQRAETLRQIAKKQMDKYRKKFIGQNLDIVVEKISKDKIYGKTEYYFDVETKYKNTNKDLIGEIINVKVK